MSTSQMHNAFRMHTAALRLELELLRNTVRAWWRGRPVPFSAEDVPPPCSPAWRRWRWWLHYVAGGRVGTFCRSSWCRPCASWREWAAAGSPLRRQPGVQVVA